MAAPNKVALQMWDRYQDLRDITISYRQERDKMRKMAAGFQTHRQKKDEIDSRGEVDIHINKIRQVLRMRVALQVANKPVGKILGFHEEDEGMASLINEFLDYHWYNSDGQIQLSRAVNDQHEVGIGWMGIFADNIADYGRGELKYKFIPYNEIYMDPAASNWDYSDTSMIIHSKLVKPEDFYAANPNIRRNEQFLVLNDEIYWDATNDQGNIAEYGTPQTTSITGERRDFIRVLDSYEKIIRKIPVIIQPATGQVTRVLDEGEEPSESEKVFLKKGAISQEDILQFAKTEEEAQALLQVDPEFFRLETKEVPIPRIKFTKTLSGVKQIGKSTILPISDYPLKPIIGQDLKNGYPIGEVDNLVAPQELLNTSLRLSFLNAALGSNTRFFADTERMTDETLEELSNNMAAPGQVIDMKRDVNGNWPIEVVRPEPLTQAWFTMQQYLEGQIMSEVQQLQLRTGDASAAPHTFNATMALGQWATDLLRVPLTYMESALTSLNNVLLEWIPKFYDSEKMFHIVGPHGDPSVRFFNPVEFTDTLNAFNTLNTTTSIKASYRIRAGSTMPSQDVAELDLMMQLAQLNPALVGEAIKKIPGLSDSDKRRIVEVIDVNVQLQQQIQQQEEENSALRQQLQHVTQSAQSLQVKQEVDKASNKFKDIIRDEEIDAAKRKAKSDSDSQSKE